MLVAALPSEAARRKTRKPQAVSPSGGSGESALLNRILSTEDHRLEKDRTVINALNSPSRRISKAAFLALGRIKDASALDEIAKFLNRKDVTNKKLAAFSLGLIGSDIALKILQQHSAMQRDPEVLTAIITAMGRAGNDSTVAPIAAFLKDEEPQEIVQAACRGLGILWSGGSDKWPVPQDVLTRLAKLAAGPEPTARSAAFALSRYKGDGTLLPAALVVEAATKSQDPATRAFLCRALAKVKTMESSLFLSSELGSPSADPAVRIEAAKALALQSAAETSMSALKKTISSFTAPTHLIYQSMETIFNYGPASSPKLSEPVDSLFKTAPSMWIRGAALKTLTGINPVLGKQRIAEVLTAPGSPLTDAAVGALGIAGQPEDLEKLAGYVGSPELKVAEAAIEALTQLPEDKVPQSAKPTLRRVLERGDTALTSLVSQLVEKFKWKEFAPSLASVYRLLIDPDQVEAKIAVLNALAAVGDHSHMDVVEAAIGDNERLVVVAAVNAKKAITGKDDSAKIPHNSKVTGPFPSSYSEVWPATHARVSLKTNRGEIMLKMVDEAPLTAYHFIRLVKTGFYDGKTFHRVVPNFVVQGGDPHGDGYGGPGFLIRDEVSALSHERGTVGIATAGPDTGGCQFFFNLGPNLHLDGKYTLFAEIISGIEVIDKLEVGDRILSARVK